MKKRKNKILVFDIDGKKFACKAVTKAVDHLAERGIVISETAICRQLRLNPYRLTMIVDSEKILKIEVIKLLNNE